MATSALRAAACEVAATVAPDCRGGCADAACLGGVGGRVAASWRGLDALDEAGVCIAAGVAPGDGERPARSCNMVCAAASCSTLEDAVGRSADGERERSLTRLRGQQEGGQGEAKAVALVLAWPHSSLAVHGSLATSSLPTCGQRSGIGRTNLSGCDGCPGPEREAGRIFASAHTRLSPLGARLSTVLAKGLASGTPCGAHTGANTEGSAAVP